MTQYFYSPSTSGFYIGGESDSIPDDAISITRELYVSLLEGQSLGKKIVYKSRKVQLEDQLIPSVTWDQIRNRRDNLLTKSDWTQIPDNQISPELKEEWQVYRQALRDITNLFTNPDQVVWPIAPDHKDTTPTEV